jgi:hypothetical protein
VYPCVFRFAVSMSSPFPSSMRCVHFAWEAALALSAPSGNRDYHLHYQSGTKASLPDECRTHGAVPNIRPQHSRGAGNRLRAPVHAPHNPYGQAAAPSGSTMFRHQLASPAQYAND